jgi:exodeoxyribonuclease VII large subunit
VTEKINGINTRKYLSVTDFTKLVKYNLENTFTDVFLKGEISNFRPSTSGHWYFSLKDNNASIKAIVFKNSQINILNLLKSYNSSSLNNGQEVLVEGRINVYEKSGEYSIIINKIHPVGIGELTAKFEMLKEKLSGEGLFDQEHKKELPLYPETIGIVTSPTGAALQDILNVLKRRFSAVRIIIFPASVQGDEAKNEIVQAIKCADYHYRKNSDKRADVLIVARGGGSIEDLWAFNEEMVAKAIYNAEIPIITGIGHEIDFTISDFCADLRAPTPSAAAEIVVRNREDLINSINSDRLRIEIAFKNIYEKIIFRYERSSSKKINSLFEKIYQSRSQDLTHSYEKLQSLFREQYNIRKQKLIHMMDKLNNLSPLNILKRGYSIMTDKKSNIIRSYKQIGNGESYDIILDEGHVEVQAINVSDKSKFISE